MTSLTTPLTEEQVRALKVGEPVQLTGVVFTGRDAVHQYLAGGGDLPPQVQLRGGVIYHCGPVVLPQEPAGWKVIAAGPTTSIREEPYQAQVIEKYGVRAIIGKGGMGERTLAACRRCGCVYLHAVGGAAQALAECIQAVRAVYLADRFGAPEGIWELAVQDFPALVTMDAHGDSLHKDILARSQAALSRLMREGRGSEG
jgi:fumarate hydratase class I